jgi:hypothetical protein
MDLTDHIPIPGSETAMKYQAWVMLMFGKVESKIAGEPRFIDYVGEKSLSQLSPLLWRNRGNHIVVKREVTKPAEIDHGHKRRQRVLSLLTFRLDFLRMTLRDEMPDIRSAYHEPRNSQYFTFTIICRSLGRFFTLMGIRPSSDRNSIT